MHPTDLPPGQLPSNTPTRVTDTNLLHRWGYNETAPADIVDMVKLSNHISTLRAGQIVAHLGFASQEQIEQHLNSKPSNVPIIEYLADKIEGLRPHIERILALQDHMPYYSTLPPAYPLAHLHEKERKALERKCAELDAALVVTPTGSPCLVFSKHNKASDYAKAGVSERASDPFRHYLQKDPIPAVGSPKAILERATHEYASDTGELEQTCITPESATTEEQTRLITMLREAIGEGAHNIAFQPTPGGMTQVRMRLHGRMTPLRTTKEIPPESAINIARTLHQWSNATYTASGNKVTSQLLGPADGQFTYRDSDRETRVRTAFTRPETLSNQPLESISIRFLPRDTHAVDLNDHQINPSVIAALTDAMREDNGLTLIVGGTGEGKSTTALGTLGSYLQLYGDTKNCLSIENPAERLTEGLVSHSISRDVGFAVMMQAILRQDPDLIFVGEMRDRSSTSIGVRAANSGHQVISTHHSPDPMKAIASLRAYLMNTTVTNDADVVITEHDLISSLNLIVAQRLIPTLCPHCRQAVPAEAQQHTAESLIRFAIKHGNIPHPELTKNSQEDELRAKNIAARIRQAVTSAYTINKQGCKHCNTRGTIGVLPINEYFAPDDYCKQILNEMAATNRFTPKRLTPWRSQTLFDAALEYVEQGITPIDSLYV